MLLSPLSQQGKLSHREGNAWPKITQPSVESRLRGQVILPLGLNKGVISSKDPQGPSKDAKVYSSSVLRLASD